MEYWSDGVLGAKKSRKKAGNTSKKGLKWNPHRGPPPTENWQLTLTTPTP